MSQERSSIKNKKYWTNKVHDVLISVEKSSENADASSGGVLLPVKGGAEHGQFCYIVSMKTDKIRIHSGTIKPDEIILELQSYKVAGCTWHDLQMLFKELVATFPTLTMKLVKTGGGSNDLSKDLRPFLTQRFAKGSIEYQLQSDVRENLYMRTVPCTTRQPRPGEVNGVDYWFVTVDEFLAKDKNGDLLESGVYEGNYYGTPRPPKDPPPLLPNGNGIASTMMKRFAQNGQGNTTNGGIPGQHTPVQSDDHVGLSSSSPNVQINGDGVPIVNGNGHLPQQQHQQQQSQDEEPLPEGWERVDDPHYGVYYIDHINKRTQYDKPTAASASAASVGGANEIAPVGSSSGVLTSSSAAVDSNGNVLAGSPLQQQQQQQASVVSVNGQSGQSQQQQQSMTLLQSQTGLRYNAGTASAFFTTDPSQLRGEFIGTRLTKTTTGFGFTIVGGDNTNEEFLQIKSIIPNGAADCDGKLKTGDVLVYVNNVLTLGYSHADAVRLFQTIPIGASADIEVCRGYPLPFDPNDPSMEYLTTVAVSSGQQNFPCISQQQMVPNSIISPPPPVVYYTIPIVKGPSGFGFTITTSPSGQRVKQILDRPRCRTLLEGDLLCEINSVNVTNIPHPDVVSLLKLCPVGQEAIIVVQRSSPNFHSPPVSSSSLLLQQSTILPQNGYGLPPPATMTRSFTTGDGFDMPMPITHTVSEGYLLREEHRVPEQGGQMPPPPPPPILYNQQQLQRSRTPGPETMLRPALTTSTYPSAAALVDDSQHVQQVMAMNQSFHSAMAGLSMSGSVNGTSSRNMGGVMHSPSLQLPYQEFSMSLRRFESGFGFRLIGGREENSQISVGHIVEDGAAAQDGRLKTGDEIIAIDGTPLLGASHQLAVQLMSEASQRGIVALSLRRRLDPTQALHLSLPRTSTLRPNGTQSGMGSPRIATSVSPPTPPQPLQAATITLSRSDDEGFGFVVVSSVNRSGSSIGHIIENSPAARCGQLRIGDRILAINGVDTSTLSHGDVINLIKESGQALRLTILPTPSTEVPFGSPTQQQSQQLQQAPPEPPLPYHQQMSNTLNRTIQSQTQQPQQPSPGSAAFELVPVELHRGARGFGFSIRGGREFGGMPLYVLRIADGGAAALDGRLQVGDEILEINGQSAMGMTHAQAIDLIQSGGSPIVRLVVRRFRKTDA